MSSHLRLLSYTSCAAVLALGYAWRPWPGYGWYIITAAHGVGLLAHYAASTSHKPAHDILVCLACLTLGIATLHTATTLVPSTAANHGWGFGLSTWLVALHALLTLESAPSGQ